MIWHMLTEAIAFRIMIRAVRYWTDHHMDQFDYWKFTNRFGNPTYFSLAHQTEYPGIFIDLDEEEAE